MKTSRLAVCAASLVLALGGELAVSQSATPAPTRICPAIACASDTPYDPVCASNGRTYDSMCEFSIQCDFDNLTITASGACYSCATTKVCPETIDLACGSDGKTYDNECALVLAKCKGVDVALAHFGKCAAAHC